MREISIDKFKPRDYQKPVLDAFEKHGYKRGLLIWPRRAGKDIVAFNLMISAALNKVGTYFYVFPTFSSGRRILWDAITNSGLRVLDFIPRELIDSKNEVQMRIRLVNSSIIQIIGSDNYDNSLIGTNPIGMVFSEYALQDEAAFSFSRPILAANDGWALFVSTPRGKNHLYTMFTMAIQDPDRWYVSKLTVDDTRHISKEALESEALELSEDLMQQEYYTSFTMGVEGAYYSKYIDRMHINNQIDLVPWESGAKVHTAWDIGVRDSTAIIFFQTIGTTTRIIDCYEKNKEGLEHYIKVIQDKPYIYGRHIAPHDIAVREFGTGMTRLEKARHLGINFTVAPSLSIMDGIEAVRSALSKIYIDKNKCIPLIKAIENYRQEFDAKRKVYNAHPLHDSNSHFADALRYLCIALPKTRDGMSQDDVSRIRTEALYGNSGSLPGIFGSSSTGNFNR